LVSDAKPESFVIVEYPEDLISKKGDKTYILSKTLVQTVVVRFLAKTETWVLLIAAGETSGGNFGLSLKMAEMLEPMFPYRRVSRYEFARIKFDHPNLTPIQKDLLTQLSSIVGDMIKHMETQYNQLPPTASFEEINDLGNEKKMENYW